MPSFDIVSKTDLNEVDNALNNVSREIETRYDFKGSNCSIERAESVLTIHADDDLKLRQMHELLQGHLTRRKVDAGVLDYKEPVNAAGQSVRQQVIVREGIDKELAKKLVKQIKGSKIKVQVAIQGDELRVTGKKRDELQEVIAFCKGLDVGLPLQYVNFRD
ncbi:YajQ family cyclic di-GMP-binding protein [Sneathiella sp. P13V-1]|uniref:YajQ family cyclic di-GMP-binding protein n=1 Tax=Sneathiella sp. P13V-1 TaxID=2697366 RepID=UPI00187B9738|nr:YajQ family cyclic di-GMP-binding protein [Sneathiella sp. P13V-1]MBE7637917.1 YajQ family cyclic di-GMP-binding protein [Sneathiella sp. P13V-1]